MSAAATFHAPGAKAYLRRRGRACKPVARGCAGKEAQLLRTRAAEEGSDDGIGLSNGVLASQCGLSSAITGHTPSVSARVCEEGNRAHALSTSEALSSAASPSTGVRTACEAAGQRRQNQLQAQHRQRNCFRTARGFNTFEPFETYENMLVGMCATSQIRRVHFADLLLAK